MYDYRLGLQSYEKTSEVQKESLLFFISEFQ